MTLISIAQIEESLPFILALTGDLVNIESPSTDKAAVDRLGARVRQELAALPGTVSVFPRPDAGDHIRYHQGGDEPGVLLLCHMDTVYDLGTLAKRPLHQADGRLIGPGALDMKTSIGMLMAALRFLQEHAIRPALPVTALFTSDEETGSDTSRGLIEAEAGRAALVLCLEPALANGAVKTARKGTGDILLRVQGVAAHAGVNHAQGRNALEELAHHILAAQRLTDYERGTTVNVGVVHGGTRPNVVPESAQAEIDLRVTEMAEYDRLARWVQGLQPVLQGVQLQTSIALNRPPMPRSAVIAGAFERAAAIARQLGFDLHEGSTGGGSDANFAAPLGVAILDGLGPVGDGAHAAHEFVEIRSIAERTALLANLIANG
jgi:glutamate carboxypeptidase